MKELFRDKKGWIALAIIISGIAVLGGTKMLTRNTNITLVLLVCVAAVAVAVLHTGENKE